MTETFYDHFFGPPKKQPKIAKSKIPKQRKNTPHDGFGGYGGGSLLNASNLSSGKRPKVHESLPHSNLPEYIQAGKNMYQMGKNIYHSPLVQYTKAKIGKKLEEKKIEKEGMNIKNIGMIRPVYPGGKKTLGLGLKIKVRSNKHMIKMEDIFKQ